MWQQFEARLENELRFVGFFERLDYEIRYRDERHEVRDLSTEEELIDQAILHAMDSERLAEVVDEKFRWSLEVMDETCIALWPAPSRNYTGVVASFERDGGLSVGALEDCYACLTEEFDSTTA